MTQDGEANPETALRSSTRAGVQRTVRFHSDWLPLGLCAHGAGLLNRSKFLDSEVDQSERHCIVRKEFQEAQQKEERGATRSRLQVRRGRILHRRCCDTCYLA